MRLIILMVLLASVSADAKGQDNEFALDDYNAAFGRIQKTGMLVLGSWAAANFVGNGMPLLMLQEGSLTETTKYFMIMNMGWNVVNAALAGFGYFNVNRQSESDLASTIKRQYVSEKTFLFNAGLDVGYIAFGLYLTAKSSSSVNPEMLKGFGYSLALQGAVLFVFDLVMQVAHAKHRKELDAYLAGISQL